MVSATGRTEADVLIDGEKIVALVEPRLARRSAATVEAPPTR